jgi:hypothetical protein
VRRRRSREAGWRSSGRNTCSALNLSSFYAQTKDNPVFEQRMFSTMGIFGIGASWATPIVGRSGMSASLFVAVVSKFFPVVGMFAAAFVFPDGIHSGHGMAYLVLAMVLNFTIFLLSTLSLAKFVIRRLYPPNSIG